MRALQYESSDRLRGMLLNQTARSNSTPTIPTDAPSHMPPCKTILPGFAPAVPDDPVLDTSLLAPADNRHCVVELNVL